jgi:hypothetical protein
MFAGQVVVGADPALADAAALAEEAEVVRRNAVLVEVRGHAVAQLPA